MQSSGHSQIALIVFADNEVESLRCSVIIVMYLSKFIDFWVDRPSTGFTHDET